MLLRNIGGVGPWQRYTLLVYSCIHYFVHCNEDLHSLPGNSPPNGAVMMNENINCEQMTLEVTDNNVNTYLLCFMLLFCVFYYICVNKSYINIRVDLNTKSPCSLKPHSHYRQYLRQLLEQNSRFALGGHYACQCVLFLVLIYEIMNDGPTTGEPCPSCPLF